MADDDGLARTRRSSGRRHHPFLRHHPGDPGARGAANGWCAALARARAQAGRGSRSTPIFARASGADRDEMQRRPAARAPRWRTWCCPPSTRKPGLFGRRRTLEATIARYRDAGAVPDRREERRPRPAMSGARARRASCGSHRSAGTASSVVTDSTAAGDSFGAGVSLPRSAAGAPAAEAVDAGRDGSGGPKVIGAARRAGARPLQRFLRSGKARPMNDSRSRRQPA